MAILRFASGLLALAGVVLFIIAATHGFTGTYCFRTSGSCDLSSDVTLQWATVTWLAPVVAVVGSALWFVFRRPSG